MGTQSAPADQIGARARIERLAVTPVKGTRMSDRQAVSLEAGGVREDRLFFLIDERDRMVNGKQLGALNAAQAHYDAEQQRLSVTFPELGEVSEEIRLGDELSARFYSSAATARVVLGGFSRAFSEHLGRQVRLVQAQQESGAVDRGKAGGVSLISQASLQRLAKQAREPQIDARRFRMLIEISGVAAHEEDRWVGSRLAIGRAVVAVRGHVGRCLVTSRDPDTGEVDLPTLDLLAQYRRDALTTEPLAFGIYGEVLEPATIEVGDALALL
jgi:uncharacterized protein